MGTAHMTVHGGGRVQLHAYGGSPLSDDLLRECFSLEEGRYLIVTATVAQAKRRAHLAPASQQRDPGPQGPRPPALVFHESIRHLMDVAVLSRSEQRVALQRAADVLAADDESRRRQLRHDAEVWSQAIADLDSRGIDLSDGVPDELQERLLAPDLGDYLRELQGYLRQLETKQAGGRHTFERTARSFLDGTLTVGGRPRPFDPPAVIVLEGFTFFTPLQARFIEACEQAGRTVHLVFAYREAQSRAFAKIRETYDPWWGDSPNVLDDPSDGVGALATLKEAPFRDRSGRKDAGCFRSDREPPPPPPPRSRAVRSSCQGTRARRRR